MEATYDGPLVLLSVLVEMLASYAALDLTGRVTAAQGRARLAWLSCGAVALGVGRISYRPGLFGTALLIA